MAADPILNPTPSAHPGDMLAELAAALVPLGLALRGGFTVLPEDLMPGMRGGEAAATVLMVCNAGPQMWLAFSASPEASDGLAHPLNRWTQRQLDAIAAAAGGLALYPFDATPVWPFQRWAARAEPVHSSPLGLLIHPQYGLWHAYRAAIVLGARLPLPAFVPVASPCVSCADQPCLNTCPVGAFSASGYDVAACSSHLNHPEGADCLQGGCLARRACPVGPEYQQMAAQNGFHMRAFLQAVRGDH
jgi:hypothetical protein